MTQVRTLFPDLSIDIDHIVTTEDRLVAQISASGTPSLIFRLARGRRVFHSIGALVARVNERAEVAELWPYLNPGAMLTFPPQSRLAAPPEPDGAPGVEADAQAVMRHWERATTGAEFLNRIVASAARDCVVHATNHDVGGIALIDTQFPIMQVAFPDLTVAFEPGFVAGDRCIAQFTFDGTQHGPLGIAPPSGARVQSTGAIVARVGADQRVQELWAYLAPGMGLIFPRGDR